MHPQVTKGEPTLPSFASPRRAWAPGTLRPGWAQNLPSQQKSPKPVTPAHDGRKRENQASAFNFLQFLDLQSEKSGMELTKGARLDSSHVTFKKIVPSAVTWWRKACPTRFSRKQLERTVYKVYIAAPGLSTAYSEPGWYWDSWIFTSYYSPEGPSSFGSQ